MDFQKTLLQLRDRLQKEHNYQNIELIGNGPINHTTTPINLFLAWLQTNQEAQQILKDLNHY